MTGAGSGDAPDAKTEVSHPLIPPTPLCWAIPLLAGIDLAALALPPLASAVMDHRGE